MLTLCCTSGSNSALIQPVNYSNNHKRSLLQFGLRPNTLTHYTSLYADNNTNFYQQINCILYPQFSAFCRSLWLSQKVTSTRRPIQQHIKNVITCNIKVYYGSLPQIHCGAPSCCLKLKCRHWKGSIGDAEIC